MCKLTTVKFVISKQFMIEKLFTCTFYLNIHSVFKIYHEQVRILNKFHILPNAIQAWITILNFKISKISYALVVFKKDFI